MVAPWKGYDSVGAGGKWCDTEEIPSPFVRLGMDDAAGAHVEIAACMQPNYCFELIRKSSFFSFVPFISSRIQMGVMPRPLHLTDLFFFD